MARFRVLALALALTVTLSGPGLAQKSGANAGGVGVFSGTNVPTPSGVAALTPSRTDTGEQGQPSAYKHETRGFLIVAPPGAQITERQNGAQIAIQSRRGFAVNLQVGDANPSLSNLEMLAKLEGRYLGDGRPWNHKSDQAERTIAGLSAISATYEAGSTRTNVLIVRGAKTDFVFMFFAPAAQFNQLQPEFDWILTGFRPSPTEATAGFAAAPKEPKSDAPPIRAQVDASLSPTGRDMAGSEPAPSADKVFSEPGYGYSLSFPAQWVLEKPSAFTNVISGPKGTESFNAIVTVQNVQPSNVSDPSEAADRVFSDLKTQLSTKAQGVDFVGEKDVTYAKNGIQLGGRQFVAHYSHGGQDFRKWTLVLPRTDGNVAHVWSYTAPVAQFETFRPVAEEILNSLKIHSGEG